MVKVSTASSAIKDSASVLLEYHLVGFNEDGGGLLCNSGLHLGNVVLSDILIACCVDSGSLSFRVNASSIGGVVWIGGLNFSLECLPIAEGLVLPTTTAAVVAIACCLSGAVDELLLREAEEGSGLDEMFSLKCSSGGEGPAGSTLSLVLDWSDCTGCTPVDSCGISWLEPFGFLLIKVWLSSEHLRPLVFGVVRELVVSDCEVGVAGVVLLDEVVGL